MLSSLASPTIEGLSGRGIELVSHIVQRATPEKECAALHLEQRLRSSPSVCFAIRLSRASGVPIEQFVGDEEE